MKDITLERVIKRLRKGCVLNIESDSLIMEFNGKKLKIMEFNGEETFFVWKQQVCEPPPEKATAVIYCTTLLPLPWLWVKTTDDEELDFFFKPS